MTVEQRDLRGIGGWLGYFCLGQAIWAGFSIYDVISTRAAAAGVSNLAASVAGDAKTVVICDVIIAIVCSIGLILVFMKSARAPDFWVAATFVLGWVSIARNVTVAALSHPNTPPTPEDSGSLLRGTVVMIAWFVYWLRSKRVAMTFGSNGALRRWLNRIWLDKARPTPQA